MEYESAWSLGANCDNSDCPAVIKMIHQANELGFDAIELGQSLACYMEVTERRPGPGGARTDVGGRRRDGVAGGKGRRFAREWGTFWPRERRGLPGTLGLLSWR